MIPDSTVDKSDAVTQDFSVTTELEQPTKTYKMRLDKLRVQNYADGIEAMKQAVFKIVNTERYFYSQVYGDNFGIELQDLYGMPMDYVMAVVTQRITEALTWDQRILSVSNFSMSPNKGVLTITFNVMTIFGDFDYSMDVRF